MNEISLERSMQAERERGALAAGDYAAAKPARGRRLLFSGESKGLATTLGTA